MCKALDESGKFIRVAENKKILRSIVLTSICLIYFPESTADSKKSLGGINIPNTLSKSFNRPPIILKFSGSEIFMVIEISIGFDLLGIVEFQIYHFILPILQAHLGKKMAKILSRRVICRG